jgi:putative transposase
LDVQSDLAGGDLGDAFPATREQRCWSDRQANILSCLTKSAHPGAIATIRETYDSEDIDHAQVAIEAFEVDYGAEYPQGGRQDRR